MKTKIYALCGIAWFLMDCFWYVKFFPAALFFGGLTVATSICGLFIYNRKRNTEFYIVIATFAWIMINMCSLLGEMYPDEKLIPLFGYISIVIGSQALLAVLFINRSFFEKFRKL